MWKFVSVRVFLLFLFTFATCEESLKSANITESNFDAGCSRIFTNEQVVFESPSYPSGYPANLDCSYLFQGPACPTYFNLEFLDFNLVSSLGCVEDRLEIQDHQALCGSTSGTNSYFSPNGALQARFVSDGNMSGRGFKISVTRLPCGSKPETTTADLNIAWEMNPVTIAPKHFQPDAPPGAALPFCCANSYNSKRFLLSSPGFPYSNNNPTECVYYIYRANPNVCRLRIHFLFFWSGEQDANSGCNKGFLQVDGKFICGCRIGLKLTSAFDSNWGDAPKVLRFKNSGFPQSVFSGFALEVIQDECPKRLAPTNNSAVKTLKDERTDSQNVIEKALLVKENTEILDDDGHNHDSGGVKHVYFFEAPEDIDYEYDVRTVEKQHREIEETNYLDTSIIKSVLPDGYDNYKCRAWGGVQWAMLAQEVLWQQMPQCNGFANKPISRQCEQANFIQGYVQSPAYPYYYPGNLKLCYRFERRTGYCAIRLTFVDFQLENSFQCQKDYLNFGGKYRYCGQSLYNSVLTFDMRDNPYQEMYFVTDSYSCGRGFKGTYEQIPCYNSGGPVNPPNPIYPTKPTTPFPPPPTPPPNPQTPCSRDIQDEVFVIEVHAYNQPRCVFNIFKRYPNVCSLSLTFLNFNLPCRSEHLLINNRRYCGQLSGQTLNINFNYHQLSIIYERSTANLPITGLRLRLSGKQTSIGCDPYEFPNVPAERSIFASNNNTNQQVSTNFSSEMNANTFPDRKFAKDICGVVLNATEDTIAASICNFLTERDNSTTCVQITAKSIYVPYNSATDGFDNNRVNDLKLDDFDQIEDVGVSEVSCDDISKIKDKN